MAKKIENQMKGLYQQKLRWWFRYSHGGKQVAHNCKTRDVSEALEVKRKVLAAIAKGGLAAMPSSAKSWDQYVSDYSKEKEAKGEFRAGTTKRVKSVLKQFQLSAKIKRPEEATYKDLEEFFKESRKKSNSTAKNYMATVQAFLNDLGLLHKRFHLPKTVKVAARTTYAEMEDINRWIQQCTRPELKYIMFCLGHLGMRAGEAKFSKVEWFDKEFCNIPARMSHRLKTGAKDFWLPKDSEARSIPLTDELKQFLPSFLAGRRGLVVQSKKSRDRTWDFRLPLKKHIKEMGLAKFNPHAFRHSWITYLMNNNYDITDVATWSGDTLETLQKHYWHKKKKAGALDVTGKKKLSQADKELSAMKEQMEDMKKMMGSLLNVVQQTKEEKITKTEALNELKKNPTFAPVVEDFSVRAMLDKMTPKQREEFLNSLPF